MATKAELDRARRQRQQEVLALYEQRVPAEQIADQFGVHINTIYRWMAELGAGRIPVRAAEIAAPVEAVVGLHNEGLHDTEIAGRLGVSATTIAARREAADLPRHPWGGSTRRYDISRADLVRLYVKGGESLEAVAAEFGCSRDTVTEALRRHGLPVRNPKQRVEYDTETLRRLYVDDGLTAAQIADQFGVHQTSVNTALRAAGIAVRPRAKVAYDPAELERQYVELGLSCASIAALLGGTEDTVRRALRHHNIAIRGRGPTPTQPETT